MPSYKSRQNEILTFDWGVGIIGVLDVKRSQYIPYRSREKMVEGATRLRSSTGIIVSFNGNRRDLMELSKILGLPSINALHLKCTHHDMAEIISEIRWPPDPGTKPILGTNLSDTYRHYFGEKSITAPSSLADAYERDNWRDCYMTAELWKKWKCGTLR